VAAFEPIYSFFVFLMLIRALAFNDKRVVRDLHTHIVQLHAGEVGSNNELSILLEHIDPGCKCSLLARTESSEVAKSATFEHTIHVVSEPSDEAKRTECRQPFEPCWLITTSWLNGPRLFFISARH